MAGPPQEAQRQRDAAATRRVAAAIERETEAQLRRAGARTRAAVAAVLREQREHSASAGRGARGAVTSAWSRPPSALFHSAMTTPHNAGWSRRAGRGTSAAPQGSIDPRHSPFHFKLHQSHETKASVQHQKYIERDTACIASFGNIDDTQGQRIRLWDAIGERTKDRGGTIRVDFSERSDIAVEVLNALPEWTQRSIIDSRAAKAVASRARAVIQGAGRDLYDPVQGPEPEHHPQPHDEADERPSNKRRNRKKSLNRGPEHSVSLWINDPDIHKQVLKDVTSWIPEHERAKRLRAYRPRHGIVQRRIVLELAHEIDDDARERALRRWCDEQLGANGLAWHAVIHAPENNNDARNYHAHVVYTQFALERDPDPDYGRWTFENERLVPEPSATIKTLSGNGPDKRKGRNALIKHWRTRWAEVQNDELEAIGATKRYDPRSYTDQGRTDLVPGKHRGTVRSAMEERGEAAAQTAQSAEAQWQALAADIADHLGVTEKPDPPQRPDWSHCLPEPVRDAFESLRLASGMGNADPELRASLIEAMDIYSEQDSPPDPATREGQAAAWLRRLRDEPEALLELSDHPDFRRWRHVERTVLDTAERDRRAREIVEHWNPELTERARRDPRPHVRRLHASARRGRLIERRWRDHLAELHRRVEPAILEERQIDTLLQDLDHAGVTVIAAFGREGALRLSTARALARTLSGLRELEHGVVNGHDNRRCAQRIHALRRRNRRALARLNPDERQGIEERYALLNAAIGIRRNFQQATESQTPRMLTATARGISRPVEGGPRERELHASALAMLSRSERAEIARAARDASAVLVTHNAHLRIIATAMQRLGTQEQRTNDPARVDALAGDEALRNQLQAVSPTDAHTVDLAIQALAKRRLTVARARSKATEQVKKSKRTDAQGLARLTPGQAADLYGSDPPVMRNDHPDMVAEIQGRLDEYPRVVARAIRRVRDETPDPEEAGYRIAHLCTPAQRRALEAAGAPCLQDIARALEREARQRTLTELQIRHLTASLVLEDEDPDDPATRAAQDKLAPLFERSRSERIRALHDLITHPRTATRLTRKELRRASRRAGLFGAPQAPAPPSAPGPAREQSEAQR